MVRTYSSHPSFKFGLRAIQSFLGVIANKCFLDCLLGMFVQLGNRIEAYFVAGLLQIQKRLTKIIRLPEQIEALIYSLYIAKHLPNEMRVMRLHVLRLLHGKHFIVYA